MPKAKSSGYTPTKPPDLPPDAAPNGRNHALPSPAEAAVALLVLSTGEALNALNDIANQVHDLVEVLAVAHGVEWSVAVSLPKTPIKTLTAFFRAEGHDSASAKMLAERAQRHTKFPFKARELAEHFATRLAEAAGDVDILAGPLNGQDIRVICSKQ